MKEETWCSPLKESVPRVGLATECNLIGTRQLEIDIDTQHHRLECRQLREQIKSTQ